jgi:peptide/nickel transport system substrate-binding protein
MESSTTDVRIGSDGTPRSRPWQLLVAGAVALALLAAACGSSTGQKAGSQSTTTTVGKPVDGGSIVFAVPAESDTWNAATAEWAAAGTFVGSSVLEPLAKLNARDGADPWLATSWIADSTFDRWQINLRPNVMFSDGEPMDANAVKLNLDTYVHGALSGQVLGPMVQDVRVLNPLAVVVDLKQPWAAFPSSFLDGDAALMMAPAMIHSKDGGGTHPIGTGPFVFQSWTPGQSFKVTKNPHYWQKGLPHLDSIEFRVITDPSTAMSALQNGDINMMLSMDGQTPNRLAGSYNVIKNWDSESATVLTNTTPTVDGQFNPMSNIHARRALAYATDRDAIAKLEGGGVLTGTSPFAPSGIWGLPESETGYVSYDPAKAKQEVAAYEQDTHQPSLKLTMASVSDTDSLRINQAIQAEWRKVGIEVSIQAVDQAALIKKLVASDFETVYQRNYNYADPDNEMVFWDSSTAHGVGQININFSLYKSAQIDADLHAGRIDGYVNQRQAAYHDLVRQINAAVLDIWLYRTPYSIIADKNIHGLDVPKTVPFGNFEPKTWLADLWVSKN